MLIHVLAIGLFLHTVWKICLDIWKIKNNDRIYEVNNDLRNAMNSTRIQRTMAENQLAFTNHMMNEALSDFYRGLNDDHKKDWFKNGF